MSEANIRHANASQADGDWLIDLGNSRLKLARIEGGRAGRVTAWPLSLPDLLNRLLALGAEPRHGQRAWLASSAGHVSRAAITDAMTSAGIEVRLASTQRQCRQLRIAYAEPLCLGVDRFLALLAASERSGGPWLLVSVGSALTVDLLTVDGVHVGGLIALSPSLHREALAARIPHLDVSRGVALDFASDTADALASGAQASALGLIEHSLDRARQRLGVTPTLLLTGGGAEPLLPFLDAGAQWQPALVLDGLALYAEIFASSAP